VEGDTVGQSVCSDGDSEGDQVVGDSVLSVGDVVLGAAEMGFWVFGECVAGLSVMGVAVTGLSVVGAAVTGWLVGVPVTVSVDDAVAV